jgi:predicted small lipoprotein YifL
MRATASPFTPTSARLRRVNLPPSRERRQLGGGVYKRVLVCLVLVLMVLIPSSCGRKGAPFLPQESTNARVINLRGAWQEGYIDLKGSILGASDAESTLTGARVNYAIYPVDEAPCDGCPIDYKGFHTFGPEAVQQGQFFCRIPEVVKGNIYYFEVELAGPKGGLGPASDQVKVVVQ